MILKFDGIVQLGIKFSCIYCETIHLAVSVPCHKGRASGSAWARGDSAVYVIVFSVPSWNGFTSKAMGVSEGIGNTAAFDAATAAAAAAAAAKMSVKDVSPSSGPRPTPWFRMSTEGSSIKPPSLSL